MSATRNESGKSPRARQTANSKRRRGQKKKKGEGNSDTSRKIHTTRAYNRCDNTSTGLIELSKQSIQTMAINKQETYSFDRL